MPLRVAMVSLSASPLAVVADEAVSPLDVHLASLATTLGARGHDVTVYTRRSRPGLADRVPLGPGAAVEHVTAGPLRRLASPELLAWVADFGQGLASRWTDAAAGGRVPEVAHAHSWTSGLAAVLVRRSTGVPVVQSFHSLEVLERRRLARPDAALPERIRLEGAIARDVEHLIATSSEEAAELARLGAPRRSVTVIPCGIDLDRFTEDGPSRSRDGGRHIVGVGSLDEAGGLDALVEVLRTLPATQLSLAGGPPPRLLPQDPGAARLRRLAERHGVRDRVRLLGRVRREDMPALLRSADIVACVPAHESFGMAALEAMACRRPVVASPVGGLADTVADGVTGVLVPSHRPERLGAVLRSLLDDPFRLEAYGQAGIDRARSRFGWERIAGETEQVYAAVRHPVRAAVPGQAQPGSVSPPIGASTSPV